MTRAYMLRAYDQQEWAGRDPIVMKGTISSGDNYWKGCYDEANAILITETYGCPDPYAGSEMEDHALAIVLKNMGMLDRYIIVRDSVNLDIFVNGATPENLWSHGEEYVNSKLERADIFSTGMENNYKVGRQIIDAILDGTIH